MFFKNSRGHMRYLALFLCFLQFIELKGQEQSIQGKVTDKKEMLSGVTIKIVGKSIATSSNKNGEFKILAKKGDALEFRLLGYNQKTVVVGSDIWLNIDLEKSDNQSLDEVVVIGYGKVQKQDMTGSVSQIDMKSVKDMPVSGIDQKLTGRIAGVQIKTPTGVAGGGSQIKIRGSGSIGAGDDPLFVIDGFPITSSSGRTSNPLNLISPDDIESITVLKDASSTAIYGSRGSNGVIIVTTKKGKAGIPTLSISGYTGVASVPQKGRPNMLNAQQFARFRREIIEDDFAARGLVATDNDIPEEYRDPLKYGEGTNWYDQLFRNAGQHNINASVQGGGENGKYAISLGYLSQDGVLKYTGYDRFTGRMNIESNLNKKLKVGMSISPTYSKQIINDFETSFVDIITSSLWYSPLVPLLDANGNRTPYITSSGMYSGPNPLNKLEYGANTQKLFRGLGTAFLEYQIWDELSAKYSYSVDYSVTNGAVFNPAAVGGINTPPTSSVANSGNSRGNTFNWLSEFLLNYNHKFSDRLKMDAVLGISAQKERGEGLNINATNYPDDIIKTINAASTISGWSQDIQEWALMSYFARANFNLDNKWILTGTIRRDGSSRFGLQNKYGTFPSGALAYKMSEEAFMKVIPWIDELKVRGSYGLSGNFNIGNYAFASTIGTANYAFGDALASGRAQTSLSNPNLTWEESNQLDLGVDMQLFKNRLHLTADYYNRITKGMLYNAEIPVSTGFSNALINSGRIRNSGLEIGADIAVLDGGFKWNTNFNIAFNRNKVLALNDKDDPIYSGRSGEGHYTHITQVGSPIGLFYGYVNEGVYKTQADFDNSPKHATSVLGSIKYKDVDGNGIIEPVNDFAVIGNPNPDFIFGMTNSFNYRGFDLSVLMTGTYGNQILRQANQYLTNIDGIFNVDTRVLDRWRSEENPGNGQIPTTNGARVLYRDVNSAWVENGSYLRVQNLTLGYKFPTSSLKSVLSNLRIFGSVQNLATITKYKGGNPDVVPRSNELGGSLALVPGLDFTSYPLPRTFTIGLNANF